MGRTNFTPHYRSLSHCQDRFRAKSGRTSPEPEDRTSSSLDLLQVGFHFLRVEGPNEDHRLRAGGRVGFVSVASKIRGKSNPTPSVAPLLGKFFSISSTSAVFRSLAVAPPFTSKLSAVKHTFTNIVVLSVTWSTFTVFQVTVDLPDVTELQWVGERAIIELAPVLECFEVLVRVGQPLLSPSCTARQNGLTRPCT